MSTEFKIRIPGKARAITMSGEEIRILLLRRKKTVTDLAKLIGQKRNTVSMVLHGHNQTPAIRKAITEKVEEILAEAPRSNAQGTRAA